MDSVGIAKLTAAFAAAFVAGGINMFTKNTPNSTMAPNITPSGGNQPHDNFQPYLCIDFIISLFGVYPSPT